MSNNPHKQKFPELRVRGVSDKTREILENIAQNTMGIKANEFLKIKIGEIILNTPEEYKRKPLEG